MRKFCTAAIMLFLLSSSGYSQAAKSGGTSGGQGKGYKVRWKTAPFDHQVFIRNEGQFDGAFPGKEKIFFGAQLGNVWAYFTARGIEYCYKEFPKVIEGDEGKDPDKDGPVKPVLHYTNSNWVGAASNTDIQTYGEQSYYYSYTTEAKTIVKTKIFKKIIYRNIYPGIDVEYTFPKGKQGLKYAIIVHPGADISNLKLNNENSGGLKIDKNGDINFNSQIGTFTEHAPVSYYSGEPGDEIEVSYALNGNNESFTIKGDYDKSKMLIIDPWVTNPNFGPTYDRAYDIDYDYHGNVYAYGSYMPYQVEKFNSSGVPLWVYNATAFSNFNYYGDIAVNRISGTVYITEGFDNAPGAKAMKINTNGTWLATYPGTNQLNEFWRIVYNPCYNNIVIGAGGTVADNQASLLDTNMVSVTPVNVLGATTGLHDIVLIAPDPSGLYCYMATAQSAAYPAVFNNQIMQLPLPSLTPTTYITPDNFDFQESNVPSYTGPGFDIANGYDGIAVSPNWLYIYNSLTLKRLVKNTGLLADSIPINNSILTDGKPNWGGLAVDPCDDIFVGCQDSVKVYNSSMVLDTSITLNNTVYDLVLGQNNLLYAAGDSFVCAITVPPLASLISSVSGNPSSCSACDGTVTVNVNCGVAPFAFLWSNGSTNQTDTGLCAGIYSVRVTDGSCPPRFDSAIVVISGKPGYSASVIDTNPDCAHSLGNITAYPTGGTSPYTYSWSNGETTQEDIGLSAGTYNCIITGYDSCKTFVSVTLVNPVTPIIAIFPNKDSICNGSNIVITASGVNTYTWTPNNGLSCDTCPAPTASPTATTTYTVNGLDTNGCSASATVTVNVYPIPTPVVNGKDSICAGTPDTLTVSGGTTYLWQNGATTTSITIAPLTTRTITVTAYNGPCSHDTNIVIHVVSPAAAIVPSKDSTCAGDTVKLTGSGGTSYLWSNSSTSGTIIVSPTLPTTYTLYAAYGTCRDSATVTIGIIKPLAVNITSNPDSVCPGVPAALSVNISQGSGTYSWSTGATTSSISVTDTASTTYSVTVYGKCDTAHLTKTVMIVPFPKPVITGTVVKCAGSKDTLTVSGGATYKWSSGVTTTTYYTGAIKGDSVITVVAYNSLGCPDTAHFPITVRAYPTGAITYIPACINNPTTLIVTATGTGPFTYKWSTGGTYDTINVTMKDSTYSVIISNGCLTTKTVAITPEYPNLDACCDKTIFTGEDTIINASGTGIIHYQWSPASSLNCDTCATVIATPTATTTYTVIGTDSLGCQSERIVTITIEIPCFNFIVPNVFTPDYPGTVGANGGYNNVFYIQTDNVNGWSIFIYDRWGKEVFKSSSPTEYWNGNTEGGGKAPDGVYYYIITATCQNTSYKKDGFLQLIR